MVPLCVADVLQPLLEECACVGFQEIRANERHSFQKPKVFSQDFFKPFESKVQKLTMNGFSG
jgi:hypothetical protein